MKLVIVESPAKAKTIGKYLGDDYVIRASVGHVRDLPKSNKKAIDIGGGFVPHYEIVKNKEHVIDELREAAEQADEIILATDPDREGEAIAWHLKEALHLKSPQRIVFHEITEGAVKEAMKHPRTIDEDLRKAQEARRVLDRLVGYDLSGLIWKKVRYGLSAGRVQSPALRILMEREREIRKFIPEDYWVITALFRAAEGEFPGICSVEPRDKKEVDRILTTAQNGSWSVSDITEQEVKRNPRPPFITSTLQQSASTRLGFTPARAMQLAQKLYEAGHITYMRTDSTSLSKDALKQICAAIEKRYGKEYVERRVFKTTSKSAQEAHEAIRPTRIGKEFAGTTEEQKKLYKLIWSRTVASQMASAKVLRTKILSHCVQKSGDNIPDFQTNGSRVLFPGWLTADPLSRGEDVEVPKLKKGASLTLKEIHDEARQTQPPSRYTEAGLIKELEKRGIGRPSTYASIMKTILDRGYVEKQGRTLIPTDTGDVISSFLEKNFMKYISDDFTSEMEQELDEIADGKREYEKTLREFYIPFHNNVESKEHIDKLTNLGDAPKEFRCPKCGKSMIIKLGRGGKFMSCSNFPECIGARTIEGATIEPDKPIGKDPETGNDVYLLTGRFGSYVQLGEVVKNSKNSVRGGSASGGKPRTASIPKDKNPSDVTLADALKYLSLPRVLGNHPDTGEPITANNGRFGPYIVHQKDFRSLKKDSVYTIELPRALEIFKEPKKTKRKKKTR